MSPRLIANNSSRWSSHSNRDKSFSQDAGTRDQQPNQVHGVLPLHLSLIPNIGLHLLELRHDVPVVRLVDETGEKNVPHPEQFLSQRSRLFDQWRVETLQHVRVRF